MGKVKTVAVVQARIGSTRFPGKVFADIAGKPMIHRVVERARLIPGVDLVVLATAERDERFKRFAYEMRLDWFFGAPRLDPDNVLSRVYWAARAAQADHVVRITGDCPLLDPAMSGRVVSLYTHPNTPVDYVSNISPATDGFDTEIFSFATLERAWQRHGVDRQHVTTWMRSSDRVRRLDVAEPGRSVHLSVDTPDDLEVVRTIYKTVNKDVFTYSEALAAYAIIQELV